MNKLIITLCLVLGTLPFFTVDLSDSHHKIKTNPAFNIEDYSWLVGSWTGDGFGGISHETWSEPVNGTMMGMYRHIKDGELVFYEFLLLDENGMRLKHFNPDLTGWEEKDDYTEFEMISFSKDKIEMKGLVFERKSDTEMVISLKMKQNDEVRTEVFNMKRTD